MYLDEQTHKCDWLKFCQVSNGHQEGIRIHYMYALLTLKAVTMDTYRV